MVRSQRRRLHVIDTTNQSVVVVNTPIIAIMRIHHVMLMSITIKCLLTFQGKREGFPEQDHKIVSSYPSIHRHHDLLSLITHYRNDATFALLLLVMIDHLNIYLSSLSHFCRLICWLLNYCRDARYS